MEIKDSRLRAMQLRRMRQKRSQELSGAESESRFLTPAEKQVRRLGQLVQESRRRVSGERSREAELERLVEEGGLQLAEPDEVPLMEECVVEEVSRSDPSRAVVSSDSCRDEQGFAPLKGAPKSLGRDNLDSRIKQKNVQLRMDQIISLREYSFRSGNLDGHQLNESQIIRVALDLLFWLDVDPEDISTEDKLFRIVEEFLGIKRDN